MKVLLCIREDYNRNFGGDSLQLLKTAYYLKKNGAEAEINNGGVLDYSKYDIVHLFNLMSMGETYKYYKLAHYYKKDTVISPLYWNLKKYYEYKKDMESIKLWEKCEIYRKEILKGCRMILCNCSLEENILRKDFHVDTPTQVVYNGVEVENEDIPLYNFKERHNLDNYILCVGKINNLKNQLMLCRACYKLGLTLVLIGAADDKAYFDECMKYKNVVYLGIMDSYNVYNAYRFAKLHVLPGFIETPRLSSLEAAAAGCNVVATSEGSAQEYLKDMAVYCNPYDQVSVEKAIEVGLKMSRNRILKDFVLQNYSWEKSVDAIYKIYLSILN